MADLMSVIMLVLDLAVIGVLGLALWRFGRDPSAAWEERETRLKEAVRGLQALVAEAAEQARVIDAQLAGRLEELRGRLQPDQPAPSAQASPQVDGQSGRLRRQIQDLVGSGLPIEEIARRVDMPVAEVRLLVGMQGPRGGRKVAAKTAA